MRGLAAVLVVLFHAQVVVGHEPVGGIMERILSNGALGVDIFFVLSGFIITLVHQADLGRPDRCPRYLWRRFSRIYPAVFIMSTLALATYLTGAHASESQKLDTWSVVASFLLLPQSGIPLVNVTWTLVYEVFFYAVFALAILNLGLGMGLILLWQALIVLLHLISADLTSPWAQFLRPQALEFGIGVLCAWLALSPRLRSTGLPGILLLALGCGGLFWLIALRAPEPTNTFDFHTAILAGGFSGAALLGGTLVEWRGMLRMPAFLVMLGAISYSVYLVHFSTLVLMGKFIWKYGLMPAGFQVPVILAASAVAILIGYAFHHLVDTPLQQAARRFGQAYFGSPKAKLTPAWSAAAPDTSDRLR
ncbi:acyltransferase [Roseomonas gilardii subsp. gilardii]|uniref:acyltransferase family protein n=1 Tax=Roseomonas gilardii TaxID=257708 RepID=UPI001FF88B61|nr:acyltransferase [Roseomonas gilardii]UPG73350.1 acyltransferase [Roseomonas gilardii subsp. gilardii]